MPKINKENKTYKSFDFTLFITVILLLSLGVTMVLSASSPYSLATTGSSYTLPCNWDADNKMKVNIEVSASGKETSTYTIELEKYPTNDKPYFITQPQSADYIIGDTAKALSFIASANGKLSYQWYVNTADSNEGGTALKGETAAEYTPST